MRRRSHPPEPEEKSQRKSQSVKKTFSYETRRGIFSSLDSLVSLDEDNHILKLAKLAPATLLEFCELSLLSVHDQREAVFSATNDDHSWFLS
jgi:hypothetical protein